MYIMMEFVIVKALGIVEVLVAMLLLLNFLQPSPAQPVVTLQLSPLIVDSQKAITVH